MGQFRSRNGTLIHADSNAAYNIIRKESPDAFADRIRDAGLHPVGLSIQEMISPLKVAGSHIIRLSLTVV